VPHKQEFYTDFIRPHKVFALLTKAIIAKKKGREFSPPVLATSASARSKVQGKEKEAHPYSINLGRLIINKKFQS
jgi:hypothetical protein